MLKIILSGNLGKDAELRVTQSGDSTINFTVAHKVTTQNGDQTTWVSCTKWVKAGQSTAVAQYLKKGTKVLIEGSPKARSWTNQNGEAQASLECTVYTLELMGQAPAQGQQQAQQTYQQPQQQGHTQGAGKTWSPGDAPKIIGDNPNPNLYANAGGFAPDNGFNDPGDLPF